MHVQFPGVLQKSSLHFRIGRPAVQRLLVVRRQRRVRQRRRRQLARHRRRLEVEQENFTAMYLFEINALAVCIKPLLFIKIIKF